VPYGELVGTTERLTL